MSGTTTTTRTVGGLPAVTTLPSGAEVVALVPDATVSGGKAARRAPASAFQGPAGAQGPQGVQGVQGPAGPAGPQGPAGPAGSGTATTASDAIDFAALPAGTALSATDEAIILQGGEVKRATLAAVSAASGLSPGLLAAAGALGDADEVWVTQGGEVKRLTLSTLAGYMQGKLGATGGTTTATGGGGTTTGGTTTTTPPASTTATDFAGVAANWFRFSDTATLTLSGSDISAARDLGSAADDAGQQTSAAPQLTGGVANGLPGATFGQYVGFTLARNGRQDASTFNFGPGPKPAHFFAVVRPNAVETATVLYMGNGDGGGPVNCLQLGLEANGAGMNAFFERVVSVRGTPARKGGVAVGQVCILEGIYDPGLAAGAQSRVFLNGVEGTRQSGASDSNGTVNAGYFALTLMGDNPTLGYSGSTVLEVAACAQILAGEARLQRLRYLSGRYGLGLSF